MLGVRQAGQPHRGAGPRGPLEAKAGADRDRLKISFGGHVVAEKGMRAAKYNEATATKAVSGRDVTIEVDLSLGKGAARVWTCDLTHGYIDINGSYRS